ncbi:terminase small subunit [Desulfovibrio piger]|uniref:terminase small subunit n=1 Tax=Desulfovibrio piger TaxID=901 RepID=UPI0032C121BB
MPKLTDKQAAFVREYLVDLNATQAAIRAGYSERTAYSVGQRLLKNVEIQRAVAAAQAKRARRVEIKAEDVLRGVIEVTTQARDSGDLKTALKGYELQGKHLGMWTEKVKQEVSGPDGGPVASEIVVRFVEPGGEAGNGR